MNNQDHPWIGVDNIILNDRGEILLAKRSPKMGSYPNTWGLISGYIEWGETIEEALKREAKEEINVEIEVIKFTGRYYDSKGRHPRKTLICLPHLCRIKSGTPVPKDECTEVRWFSPEEIKEMQLAYDHKQMLIDEHLI